MAGMATLRRSKSSPSDQQSPPALLASAVRISMSKVSAIPAQRDWQVRAWEYFDAVGELRFASQWIGNALSRCGLDVRINLADDGRTDPVALSDAPDSDPRAATALGELFGGATGHAEMLSRLATHLSVVGESYIIGWDPPTGERRWLVSSSDEVKRAPNGTLRVRLPEDDKWATVDPLKATVIRLWRRHPRRAWEADSPVRAALPVLKELVDLSAHIAATVESRLAGAGLLLLPDSAVLPSPLTQDGQPLHEDQAMATLIDAMVTPITNRDSAAAVVPIIARIPADAIAKVQWLTFSTPLDQKIQDLREASIRRFSAIVDIPAEVMTGMAEANRWNAWKISEDAIRIHLEPLLGLICTALTTQYLWPALIAMGVENPKSYTIWYDASNLIQRPNRGPEAQNLHEKRLIRAKTVREANGFTDADAPDETEERRSLLVQLALSGVDPYLVAPYLAALGIPLDLPELPQATEEAGTRERGRPPNPTRLVTRPDPLPTNTDREERTAVVASLHGGGSRLDFAAVELTALRALELSGKRLLNNSNRAFKGTLRRVDPWEIHTQIPATNPDELLDGAYTLLEKCVPDEPQLRSAIDAYVRECLTQQWLHDPHRLLAALCDAGCWAPGGGYRAIA